jgi:hypothetical protein
MRYGTKRSPPILETLKKFRIVNRMAIQRRMMSMRPRRGDFRPKKAMDQRIFKIS